MECKEPLEQLRHDLLRKGLPADYVGRAVQELADHHADLVEATPADRAELAESAWQRLGRVDVLGRELAWKYHQRTFAGRHPVWTFVIAPLPLLAVAWIAIFFTGWFGFFYVGYLVAGVTTWREFFTPPSALPTVSLVFMHYAVLLLPPAFGAWWYCRLARRSGRGLVWGSMACGLIALLSLVLMSDLQLPEGGNEGRLVFGLRLPFFHDDWLLIRNWGLWKFFASRFAHIELLQTLAPLAVLAYAVWRAYREQPLVRREQVVA